MVGFFRNPWSDNAGIRNYLGERVVAVNDTADWQCHFPEMSPEFLEPEFWQRMPGEATMKEMLDTLSNVLQEQNSYRRMLGLVQFALMIRAKEAPTGDDKQSTSPKERFRDEELKAFLDQTIKRLAKKAAETYVQKAKLSIRELTGHLDTVRAILEHEFIGDDGKPDSFFEILNIHLPHVDRRSYMDRHRVILEYLTKMAKNDFTERLKRESGVLQ